MFESIRARIFQSLSRAAEVEKAKTNAIAVATPEQIPVPVAGGWYGPGQTIPQMSPAGTLPRALDYSWNTNINYQPRKEEPVTFENMRALAEQNYLIRIILEKVKARIASQAWEIRLKALPGEFKGDAIERSNNDPRVKMLTERFQYPDGEHDWQTWVAGILEDKYVIDAASIWMERDSKGIIQNLVQVNGSTISRVIDNVGRTPLPPYVAYQQIVKGMPTTDLRADDLLYAVSNYRANKIYGYSEIEQTLVLSRTQINRARWTLDHYTEGNIPEVFAMFDSTKWSAAQIKEFMQTFESQLNGQSAQRQRVYPLPDGKIEQMRATELFEEFDEWLARVFCYQMGETPTAFVKQVNRATSNQMADSAEESGAMPTLNWLTWMMNKIVQHPFYFGFADVEWALLEPVEVDPLIQAQVDQINIPLGVTTVDEARLRDNKPPLQDEDALEDNDEEQSARQGSSNTTASKAAAGKKKVSSTRSTAAAPSLFSVPKGRFDY